MTLPAVAGARPATGSARPAAGARTAVVATPRREPIVTRAELALAGATLLVLAGAVVGSVLMRPPPMVHAAAQFVHLACVVLGLGGVLAVDWVGLRWRLGRATLRELVSTASALATPIWLGLGGLMLSGMFLSPDYGSAITVVKVAVVAVAGVIGVLALALSRRLAARTNPSRRLLRAGLLLAATSQLAWWTATVIGFLNRT